jgi:hypothetical protein
MLARMATAPVKKSPRPKAAAATPAPSSSQARRGPALPEVSSRTALLLGVAGLVLIAAASYAWYIGHGGLWDDDWPVTSAMFAHRADGGGWWAGVQDTWSNLAWRPVLVAYTSLIIGPLGWHLTLQFLWSVAVTTAFAGLLFAVLRDRGIATVHAFAISALVLVSTFGDAGVLWIDGATIRFAGALYLGGLLMALHALRAEDQRATLRLHAGAGLLYLTSILSYEVTAGLLWAGVLVYLGGAAPRARVLRRWGVDVAIGAVGLAWSAALTPRPSHSLSASLDHAGAIAREFWKLYDGVVAPGWLPGHTAAILTLAAIATAVTSLVLRARAIISGAPVDAVCRWAVVLLVALVYVVAAYVIFVPGDAYYLPNGRGTSNRMNTLPVAPVILVGYAAVMVLATALLSLRSRWVPIAMGVGLAYAVGMFITNERELRADQHAWAADYNVSRGVLDTMKATVPHPSKGTYVVVVGVPPVRPSGNPTFYASWDLASAARKLYDDPSIDAYNAFRGVQCSGDGLVVPGASTEGYSAKDTNSAPETSRTAGYGTVVLVDARSARAYPLRDALACQRAVAAIG